MASVSAVGRNYCSELTLTSHDDFGRNLTIKIISLYRVIKEVNMLKKTSTAWVKNFCLFSFALLISAALILGAGVNQANAAKKADTQKSIGIVDINNATQKELEDIKGVGPATAKKIIAGRPYKSVDELSKAGLSAKAVDSMKPFVKVGSAQTAPMAVAAVKATAAVKEKKAETKKGVAAKQLLFHSGIETLFIQKCRHSRQNQTLEHLERSAPTG